MRIFRHRNETSERQIPLFFFQVFRAFITFGIFIKHPKMKQYPLFMLQIVSDCWVAYSGGLGFSVEFYRFEPFLWLFDIGIGLINTIFDNFR